MAKYITELITYIIIFIMAWDKDKRGADWHYWSILALLIAHRFMFGA